MMRARKIIGEPWAQIRIMPDTSLRFRYDVGHVCTCEFSMLCEVGEKYKPYFVDIMNEYGIELGEPLEFDAAPWVADTYRIKGGPMMDIDVTDFLASTDCSMLAGSVAELGPSAGRITWQNSCDAVKQFNPLPDDTALQEFRDWLKPWGGWGDEEIADMSDEHLRALCAQWIAGDWRECFDCDPDAVDWDDYETRASEGNCPSSFYRNDAGRIFWQMEH